MFTHLVKNNPKFNFLHACWIRYWSVATGCNDIAQSSSSTMHPLSPAGHRKGSNIY
ncbi:hypothetical protein X975_25808, partial [Stegodyphus mimosarum]